jgi:DNA-binding response OmpR family regulator
MSRILIVEDDERIRSSMRVALEDEGYAVEDVASGEEAVARFTEDPFELVREMVALECGLVAIKAR